MARGEGIHLGWWNEGQKTLQKQTKATKAGSRRRGIGFESRPGRAVRTERDLDRILQLLERLKDRVDSRLEIGPVASGEWVVGDEWPARDKGVGGTLECRQGRHRRQREAPVEQGRSSWSRR